ncbi:MAG: STAS domain-containing protein [Candidatus Latescibacteria bacterium]|nr:STAS domain-containing protein [Candidatus Latescibacterota bacterium]
MTCNEQEIRGVRILHLQGEISAVAMVDLDNLLQKHQENHVRRLILDFNEVGDINYRGVGLLSERAFRMRGAGGEVKVAGLHGSVADAFQFVGADRLIEIYESPQEALASFGIQAGA